MPYLTDFTNSPTCTTLSRERITINLNHNVLPAADADSALHIGQVDGLNNRIELDTFRNGISTASPRLTLRNHNGTAAAPTHINTATDLAQLEFQGDTDAGSAIGAILQCKTTEIFSVTNNGTKCMGIGTANTTTTQTTALQWQTGVTIGAPAADPTLTRGELAIEKATASGTAPGANACKLAVVQGSAGKCTLQISCGTDATPVPISTDVGSGC